MKISLNEGSLLRRTVLHVGAFVVGTAAFLAIASFLLMTLMKGLLPSDKSASEKGDDSSEESAQNGSTTGTKPLKPPRKRRSGGAVIEAPKPAEDDDQ